MEIVLASGNEGKIAEFKHLLNDFSLKLLPQSQFGLTSAEETGSTFVENAIIKARHAAAATGLPALADDSGLAVDALEGAPGVLSARYGGPDATDKIRYEKLLDEMIDVPAEERTATFHSVIVLMEDALDPAPLVCHGVWPGYILTEARGEGGFGYDPIFYVPTHECSSAELSAEEKNKISHRALAMQDLLDIFKEVML